MTSNRIVVAEALSRIMRTCLAAVLAVTLLGSTGAASAAADGLESAGQVFTAPRGRIENVRFEQVGGGVLHVFYDLVSAEPKAVFDVSLEVSQDNGQTFGSAARSVSGDIGPGVVPGMGKRIVWEAGKDVERLDVDRFRFRVVTQAGPAAPGDPPAATNAPAAAGARSALSITSDPDGATVTIDGQTRGVTPLTIDDLAPGTHRVTVTKDGYLENSRVVTTVADGRESVSVNLTATPQTTGGTPQPAGGAQTAGGGGGGSNKLKIILPIVGGAAAAGALAAGGGGSSSGGGGGTTPTPPVATCSSTSLTAGTISAVPGTSLFAGLDAPTFTLNGAREATNLPFTITWDFGDGTGLPAQAGRTTVSRGAYTQAGTFTVRATLACSSIPSQTVSATIAVAVANPPGPFTAGCAQTRIAVPTSNINGTLSDTDCLAPGRGTRADLYTFVASAGDVVTIFMNSAATDAYLLLVNPSGVTIAQDDDGGGGTNSVIRSFRLPATAIYSIFATAFSVNGRGAYVMTVTR